MPNWPDHRTPQCRHTLNCDDPAGTWEDQARGDRYIVTCRCCRKFYGYRPHGYEPKEAHSSIREAVAARRPD